MPMPSGFTRRPEAGRQPPGAQVQNPKPTGTPPVAKVQPLRVQPVPGKTRPAARGFTQGAVIEHPKYGRGTVLRREGDGEDAKLTISFPGYGLKKIVEKYAGIKIDG
jgi:DNA helicase-2/ATP-dependent DNA helicase PcrA